MKPLLKDQAVEDCHATICRTNWAQQLLPAMGNLKRLVLPPEIGETLGLSLGLIISGKSEMTANNLRVEYLKEEDFWKSVNSSS